MFVAGCRKIEPSSCKIQPGLGGKGLGGKMSPSREDGNLPLLDGEAHFTGERNQANSSASSRSNECAGEARPRNEEDGWAVGDRQRGGSACCPVGIYLSPSVLLIVFLYANLLNYVDRHVSPPFLSCEAPSEAAPMIITPALGSSWKMGPVASEDWSWGRSRSTASTVQTIQQRSIASRSAPACGTIGRAATSQTETAPSTRRSHRRWALGEAWG